MGLLRILLAISVLLDHAHGLGGYSMIGGPLAVQSFFIISGFYMGLVLNEKYDRPAHNRIFWLNRALRIYGVYFVFLATSLLVFTLIHLDSGSSPLSPYVSSDLPIWQKVALAQLNLTVIGQDLPVWLTIDQGNLAWTYRFVPSGGGEVLHFMLIPAAWSLSLELLFYAVAPFIVRRPTMQIALICAASLLLRCVAALAGLTSDPFSYRFFPFEIALFLIGVLAYRGWAVRPEFWKAPAMKLLAAAVPLAIVSWPFWGVSPAPDWFFEPHRIALLTLFALGLPAVHEFSRHSNRDRAIGELSYPFYLGHLLVYGLVAGLPALAGNPALVVIVAVLITLLLSWLVVRVVEHPIEALRRRIAREGGVAEKGGDNPPAFA